MSLGLWVEDLDISSPDLPVSASMRNGICSAQQRWEPLTFDVDSWCLLPTPTAFQYGTTNNGDPGDGRGEYKTKGTPSLETMARKKLWPSPAARDYRFPNVRSRKERGGQLEGEQLPNVVGGPLSADWVEWLMGLPVGYTALTESALSETEWSHWQLQMASAYSELEGAGE